MHVPPEGRDPVLDVALGASRALLGIVARSMGDALDAVTLPQFRALTILAVGGPAPARDLAKALGVAPSTISRSIDRLVAAGWVDRTVNLADRRETTLVASERAVLLVQGVAVARRQLIAEVVERLAPDDAEALRVGFAAFGRAAGEPAPADLRLLGL